MVSTRSKGEVLQAGLPEPVRKERAPMTEEQKAAAKEKREAAKKAAAEAAVAATAARKEKAVEWLRGRLRARLMEEQEDEEKIVEKKMKRLTVKKLKVKQPKSGGWGSPIVWGQSTQVVEDPAVGGDEHPQLLDERGWVLGLQDGEEFLTVEDGIQLPRWA